MGRAPCCDEIGVKKGPWTAEEDEVLVNYIEKNGLGSWRQLPKLAGLNRCGKSCRLRWTNYLRPDIKRGKFSEEEERLIVHLHSVLGNKWSAIATRLAGRTDNEIKNHWNTHLRKKLLQMGIDPVTHRPRTDLNLLASIAKLLPAANLGNMTSSWDSTALLRLQADAEYLTKLQLLQSLIGTINTTTFPQSMDVTSLLGLATQLPNHQFNASLLGLADPISSSFSSFHDLPANYFQQSSLSHDGGFSSTGQLFVEGTNGGILNGSFMNPTANSTPSLVSASPPENNTEDEKQGLVNSTDSSAASVQDSDALNLDHLDNDLSWKDILDQISWSDDL